MQNLLLNCTKLFRTLMYVCMYVRMYACACVFLCMYLYMHMTAVIYTTSSSNYYMTIINVLKSRILIRTLLFLKQHLHWQEIRNPMLLYNTSLDRQIIAECNHIKIFFYNLNSLLTINILQK